MQAIVINTRPKKGEFQDKIHIQSITKPTPKKNEVLVEIYRATVTIDDINMAEGSALGGIPVGPSVSKSNPVSPGIELSGKVEKTGSNVTQFEVGDLVFGSIGLPIKAEGPWAKYCCIKEEFLLQKPDYLTHSEAAACAGSGIVACSAIIQSCKLQKHHKILIIGASGGVGTLAVQLASETGAYVIAVCSQKNKKLVESLGASKVIDYTAASFNDEFQKFNSDKLDFVVDLVGGKEIEKKSVKVLKKMGKFITIVGPIPYIGDKYLGFFGISKLLSYVLWRMFYSIFKGPRYIFCSPTKKTYPIFREIFKPESIKPVIDKEINFNEKEVKEAINYVRTHRATGKVVILVNESL